LNFFEFLVTPEGSLFLIGIIAFVCIRFIVVFIHYIDKLRDKSQ
jgi:hypothetical protein